MGAKFSLTRRDGGTTEDRTAMSKIDDLKAEVEKLPGEEFSEFFRWMTDKDWERWDREIEADSDAGKLDFLVREGREARLKGNLKAL
jgi:hypothetical protein